MEKKRRTLAVLKPANSVAQGMILERLKAAGFQVVFETTKTLGIELLERHYAHVVDEPFFQPMAEYLMSGLSVLFILERTDDADPVQSLRDLVGPTDPKKGKSGQIRHDFGVHDPDVIFMNAIHASGSTEEAEAEITLFFSTRVPSSS